MEAVAQSLGRSAGFHAVYAGEEAVVRSQLLVRRLLDALQRTAASASFASKHGVRRPLVVR